MKYFTLLHFVTDSIFSQISRLNFDYCSCLDMFYYPTFLIHQNFRTDLRYMGVHPKMKHLVWNHQKNGWRGRNTFFRFCDSNETFILMSKNWPDYYPQMSFCFVSQRKVGYSFMRKRRKMLSPFLQSAQQILENVSFNIFQKYKFSIFFKMMRRLH